MPDLLPSPVMIQLSRFDKGQVDSEAAMDSRTVNADKNAVSHAGPCWVFGVAVETDLRWRVTWPLRKYFLGQNYF